MSSAEIRVLVRCLESKVGAIRSGVYGPRGPSLAHVDRLIEDAWFEAQAEGVDADTCKLLALVIALAAAAAVARTR